MKEKTLTEALTQKKTTAGGETVVINYKMEDVSKKQRFITNILNI